MEAYQYCSIDVVLQAIFITNQQLSYLGTQKIWFVDATFRVVITIVDLSKTSMEAYWYCSIDVVLQAIFRKMGVFGCQKLYYKDHDTRMVCMQFMSLPLLPIQFIVRQFFRLEEICITSWVKPLIDLAEYIKKYLDFWKNLVSGRLGPIPGIWQN